MSAVDSCLAFASCDSGLFDYGSAGGGLDVTTLAHYPHDIVHFGSWDFNPILPHGFKRPRVELRLGHTHMYPRSGQACFRCGTYAPLHTQSFRVSHGLSL